MQPCGTVIDFSHSLATVQARNIEITRENMAEGARFELADPLRGLQFSRLARSAAPSPLHTELVGPGALIMRARRIHAVSIPLFLVSIERSNREPFHSSGDGILPLVSYSLRICSSPPM